MTERKSSLLFFIFFCLLVSGIAAYNLSESFSKEEEKAYQRISSTSHLISEWLISSFTITDYLLRDILGHVQKEDIVYPPTNLTEQKRLTELVISKMNSVPNAILVGLFDQNCILTHANKTEIGWDASARDYCARLRDDPELHTFVTNAYQSSTGPLNVTQSRRYLPDEPGFHGFAAVGVDLSFFSQWLSEVTLGPHGVIAISDRNLSLLARKPSEPETLGKQVDDPIIADFLVSGEPYRTFRAHSPLDGESRLYGVRKVENLPFVVVVGEADRDWQSGWMQSVWVTVSGIITLWIMAAFVLHAYWHRLQNLASLKEARDAMEQLSITDGLTALANRRRFDEVLASEYERSSRSHSVTSLIMIDIDYFKAFNDTYGHQAGDECLRLVADAIKNSVRRSQDLACRYGGEEFICILPETHQDAAITLATKIKDEVAELGIRHQGSKVADHVTISLGVATYAFDEKVHPEKIVQAADSYLYWAKANGRNRVGYKGVSISPQ